MVGKSGSSNSLCTLRYSLNLAGDELMRHYEIKQQEDNLFKFTCRAIPPEKVPSGYHCSFVITDISESESHSIAILARSMEDVPIFDLFDLLWKKYRGKD